MTAEHARRTEEGDAPQRKGEFRRGGAVLAGCFIGIGVSSVSLMGYSAGVFIRPLSQAFGWSRADIGAGAAFANLALVVAAPLAGRLIDRYGLRRAATASMLLYAAGVVGLSEMRGDLWVFYALGALTTLVAIASTPLAFTRAITAYYRRRRGLALGIALSSTGLAGIFAPALLAPYVETHGWRAGYQIIAFIILAAIPVVFLLVRDAPPAESVAAPTPGTAGITLSTAWRSSTFWTLAAVFALAAVAVNGVSISFVPLLLEAGKSPAQAGAITGLIGAAVIAGRLTTGYLVDRVFAPFIAAAIFLIGATTLGVFWTFGQPAAALAAIGLGLALGAEVDLIGYITSRYFGLGHYAAIFGAQYSLFLAGAGLGPIAAGAIFDLSGSYRPAVLVAVLLLSAAATTALRLRPFPSETSV